MSWVLYVCLYVYVYVLVCVIFGDVVKLYLIPVFPNPTTRVLSLEFTGSRPAPQKSGQLEAEANLSRITPRVHVPK